MGEREHLVYQAKLAEQAERYDGEWSSAAPGLDRVHTVLLLQANGAALSCGSFTWLQTY